MTDTYNPFIERAGIAPLKHKRDAAVAARIERIGQLADRRKDCTGRRDYWGLVELSYEYARTKYMHRTALEVRADAEAINRRGTNEQKNL